MAYERTWAQSLDNSQTPAASQATKLELWALKAMLLGQFGGLALGLWTIDSSCNSLVAGTQGDGVDRWHTGTYTPGDIVQAVAGSPHSWFVLKSPTMNGFNFYLLLTANSASATNASMLLAKVPFTGGTTTANPTSTDSWFLGPSAAAILNGANTNVHRFNMILSSTGDFWWFVIRAGTNQPELGVSVIAPTGCDANDGYPIWGFMQFLGGTQSCFDNQIFTSNTGITTRNYAGQNAFIPAMCSQRPVAAGTYDTLTGSQMDQPVWLVVYVISGPWHHRGRLPDCAMSWIDNVASHAPSGDSVNPGGGIIAVQLGSMLLPLTAVPNLT